jgi:tetratricopeptide (TPR) repeat protein
VDGAWDEGAPTARRQARLEAARLLLGNGEKLRAQSELIALIDDLPADSAFITRVAGLLVDAGAESRAATLLDRALALDRHNDEALRLAGGIAFRRGDYRSARTYLRSSKTVNAQSADMLTLSDAVLTLNPYAPRIASSERATRARRALDVASDRLSRCAAGAPDTSDPHTDFKNRVTAARRTSVRALAHDSDALDDLMSLVFEIEQIPTTACGALDVRDRARLAIAARRNGASQ